MIDKTDGLTLLAIPAFQRFLFSVIQTSGLFEVSANARDGRALFLEGRRSLGLDIMRAFEDAQSAQSQTGLPVVTIQRAMREGDKSIQTPDERGQSGGKEKSVERRNDQYRDLSADDE